MTGINEYQASSKVHLIWRGFVSDSIISNIFKIILFSGFLSLINMAGYSQMPNKKPDNTEMGDFYLGSKVPVLRIGLLEGYDRVDFHLRGRYTFTDLKGRKIFTSIVSDLCWRSQVEESIPSEFVYNVLLMSFLDAGRAADSASVLKNKGYPAKVVEVGGMVQADGNVTVDSRKYRLVLGDFESDDECEPYLEEFYDNFCPRIIRNLITPANGELEFYDAEYDLSSVVENGFRLIPEEPECSVIIHRVKVGTGFHWEDAIDRVYPGIVEIRLDHDGLLQAINEVSIDQYLEGVVPSEMPANYPLEALKAQSVAARSDALSKIKVKHLNDPFDLCAMVHCQVYSGLSNTASRSNQAVAGTSGEVLTFEGKICDAVYSSVCGGHTEDKENVWNSPGESYLTGIFDNRNGEIDTIDLTLEEDIPRWVDASPRVYCNVSARETPPALNGAVKYFRWEETCSRQRLEEIIKRKTGVNIGTFYSIEPIKRGRSGRLIEIEILGSRRNLKIKNELNIRRSLSVSSLKSSCFYITMTHDDDGIPAEITFHGAGWGHGVGMCQVGAAVMALEGFDYREILAHYYPGTEINHAYRVSPEGKIYRTPEALEKVLEE